MALCWVYGREYTCDGIKRDNQIRSDGLKGFEPPLEDEPGVAADAVFVGVVVSVVDGGTNLTGWSVPTSPRPKLAISSRAIKLLRIRSSILLKYF